MLTGIAAGIAWAVETVVLGYALSMAPFVSGEGAMLMAPFIATFLHDGCSAIILLIYNLIRGRGTALLSMLKDRRVIWIILASMIGGPIGMTGYVLAVNYMGASVGAVASAVYPAIGTALACLCLRERVKWYQWVFLLQTLCGVFGLSYSPVLNIESFWLGMLGAGMCAVGWGAEAVILAKHLGGGEIKSEVALNIRQAVSAVIYGAVILPIIGGWDLTTDMFIYGEVTTLMTVAAAALFATVSYLFYYSTIARIGASRAMALNITYTAWSILFSLIILGDTSVLNPTTLICAAVIVICGILAASDVKELIKRKKHN